MTTAEVLGRAASRVTTHPTECFARAAYDPSPIHKGYTDSYLHIDLSRLVIEVRRVPPVMKDMFVGGRGYCLKLVFDGTEAATRYDSPENVLAVSGGPLCGDPRFPGSGKFIVGTISPQTGTFVDSNAGGTFFSIVKRAGFDAIAVTGRSESDVIIAIDGDAGEVSIVEAGDEAEGALSAAEAWIERFAEDGPYQNVAALAAGVGGRHCVWGIINSVYYDVRRKRARAKQFGRGGTGTVMRAKGLRGVVARSRRRATNAPADLAGVAAAGKGLRRVVDRVDPQSMRMQTLGTPGLVEMLNEHHLLPVRNFQYGQDERACRVFGEEFQRRFFTPNMPDGCFYGCNLACTHGGEGFTLATGPREGQQVAIDGPEYETIAAGTNLGVFDVAFTLEYNYYCDEYGLDTISLGNALGFAFEAFDRGYLTGEDTGGLALKWGDQEVAMELVHQVAHGRGFGAVLGRGVETLKHWIAERHGARTGTPVEEALADLGRFALACKGMEFSFYTTKESLAQQGGYGYALKGPQHDESWLISIDQIRNEIPTFEQKAEALRWFPLVRTWFNIVGLCKLPWIDVRHPDASETTEPAKNLPSLQLILDHYNATLGTSKSLDDLLFESERVYTFHKILNVRHGRGTREHDRIPLRCMAPVFGNEYESRREYYDQWLQENAGIDPAGRTTAGKLRLLQESRQARYEKMTDVVYEEKGYDRNGIPTLATLKRFGFDTPELIRIVENARKGE